MFFFVEIIILVPITIYTNGLWCIHCFPCSYALGLIFGVISSGIAVLTLIVLIITVTFVVSAILISKK